MLGVPFIGHVRGMYSGVRGCRIDEMEGRWVDGIMMN